MCIQSSYWKVAKIWGNTTRPKRVPKLLPPEMHIYVLMVPRLSSKIRRLSLQCWTCLSCRREFVAVAAAAAKVKTAVVAVSWPATTSMSKGSEKIWSIGPIVTSAKFYLDKRLHLEQLKRHLKPLQRLSWGQKKPFFDLFCGL